MGADSSLARGSLWHFDIEQGVGMQGGDQLRQRKLSLARQHALGDRFAPARDYRKQERAVADLRIADKIGDCCNIGNGAAAADQMQHVERNLAIGPGSCANDGAGGCTVPDSGKAVELQAGFQAESGGKVAEIGKPGDGGLQIGGVNMRGGAAGAEGGSGCQRGSEGFRHCIRFEREHLHIAQRDTGFVERIAQPGHIMPRNQRIMLSRQLGNEGEQGDVAAFQIAGYGHKLFRRCVERRKLVQRKAACRSH